MSAEPTVCVPVLRRVAVSLALGPLVWAALVAGFWAVRWQPRETVRERRAMEVESLRKEVRALEATLRQRDRFDQEAALLDRKLEMLAKIVPLQPRLDDVRDVLGRLALKQGAQMVALAPEPALAKEFHVELPFELRVRGPWPAVIACVRRLPRLPRILTVTAVTIDEAADGTVEATVKATVFAMR